MHAMLSVCRAAKGAASLPGSVHEVMHGVGVNPRAAAAASQPGATDRLPSAPQQGVKRSTSELEEMLRQQEKAAKRARKDARRVGVAIAICDTRLPMSDYQVHGQNTPSALLCCTALQCCSGSGILRFVLQVAQVA